jgi:hypothetical protein
MMSWLLGCALVLTACGSSDGGGGTGGSGGGNATGGAPATGGNPGTGGQGEGTGGQLSTGGHSGGSGGSVSTGGSNATGGATATGGSGGHAGGAGGAGGTKATGGAGGAGGAGGKPGTGGSAGGAAGSSSNASICQFASGLNVAWVNFANDVPSPNLTTFNTIFKNTYNAGGRIVRWWFHTNGTVTPGYDSNGMAKALQQSHIDGVKAILNAAHSNGISVNISLWSFDMLQGMESIPSSVMQNNLNLLTQDANRQAYIDNYLTPLVMALQGTPGLYSYEIFNEPEGMSTNGWTSQKGGMEIDEMYIQKTVNWFAAAIHAADPTVLVTNGAVTFDYCSTVSGKSNKYSDSALRSVGGKQSGTLDFYEVHYYTSNGTSNSAFMNNASHWGLDKKLVMGEFAAQATENVAQNDLYTHLYDAGYDGAWAWSYDADYVWPAMQQAMQNVYNAHTSIVGECP